MTIEPLGRRILVCDDEVSVIDAYRRILSDLVGPTTAPAVGDLDALAADLFGDEPLVSSANGVISDVIYCRQGAEAVAVFEEAKRQGRPFSAVFLDVRMPPGIDGVETARRMRAFDPSINIVMVTGYSDHRPAEIATSVGAQDRLFYLVKPFDADEVRQMATTLAHRWSSDQHVASELAERLQQLERVNSALQASEASAHQAARRDPLTGLLNRKGLEEEYTAALSKATEHEERLSVAYVDLDRFKQVNDGHGHSVGDRFIAEVAGRIVEAVGTDGFVARVGGDEFMVVCTARSSLDLVLGRLLQVREQPFIEPGITLQVSLSIGYCDCAAGSTLAEAMHRADVALYSAKSAGRGVARAYDGDLDESIIRSKLVARELKLAIETDSLLLHYQPLMSADGLRVTGLEALLRWNHPEWGSVSPAFFVPVAEQNNLMGELGDWVLRRAMSDMRLWPNLATSINLSAMQFSRPNFADHVIQLAAASDISPSLVEFEITETALSGDMTQLVHQVEKLVLAGFKLALDDFGSGYAGIGYLSKLHFSKLKIDSSFINDLRVKPNADRMIRSIVDLGGAMGLTVTAEGVEEEFQRELLQEAGCDQMQGFLFHNPCSRQEVEALLRRQRQADRAA
jgi:diguanylate cyclase (GGDEF)-like protein